MRRAILKLGDRSTNGGVIVEGVDNCTDDGTPMSFIGARVWCNGCKSEGFIGSRGPHQIALMDGKQEALDGDICLCKCVPPPVMLASPATTSWHEFSGHELAAIGYDTGGRSMTDEYRGAFDERVRILDAHQRPITGAPYHIRTSSGAVYKGLTDASGCCPRVYTDNAARIDIAVGMQALERWGSSS